MRLQARMEEEEIMSSKLTFGLEYCEPKGSKLLTPRANQLLVLLVILVSLKRREGGVKK
jgi:hypothetical protein